MRKAIPKIQTDDEDLSRVQDHVLPPLNAVLRDLDALAGKVLGGRGSPEGRVHAPVGTLYLRSDGGTGTVLYVKETGGTGPSGWAAK